MTSIYLDHASTTPVHPLVVESMLPYFYEYFGNPSSSHSFGQTAKTALNDARDRFAQCLGCTPGQIIFTSGGTESDNMALFGAAMQSPKKNHIITSQVEHPAVLNSCRQLERKGLSVTYLPVDSTGQVRVEDVENAVRPDTVLISIMYGNNEVGTLQPIEQIGQMARAKGVCFHVDGVQGLGHVEIDLNRLPVDMMSFSAHKINGPKGIGALYVSQKVMLTPHLFGGPQERNRRAGTENVAAIIGFSKAIQLTVESIAEKRQTMNRFRQLMNDTLFQELGSGGFVVNEHPTGRLPHIFNVSFPGANMETMLINLDLEGIAASSGSACSSGSLEISHVLKAMKLPDEVARSAIRFSFGINNSRDEVKIAAQKTATIVKRLRNK